MSREKRMMNRRKSNNRNNKTIEKKTITEHITNIVGNKKLLVIMIVSVITLVTLLSTSFAMLMKSDSSEKQDLYKSGTLTVKLDKDSEGEAININPAKPITDEYGMATVKPYTFTITNTGTTNASYEVYLDETIVNNHDLTDDEVRQYIRYQIDDETPRSLGGQGSNIIVRGGIHSDEDLTFKLKLWIDIDAPIEMEGTEYSAKVGVKGKATNRMQPNGPEIVDGLIPVVYDEKTENWVKADTSTSWYNYEKQEWANAVTVYPNNREAYLSAKAGTTIPMEDINSMWVWIPRYKYRISSSIGIRTSTPPEIDIIFESRYNATGVKEIVYENSIKDDGTIDDALNDGEKIYYTHPSFINGEDPKNYNTEPYDIDGWDKELTGIWVSKFVTSTYDETCLSNMGDSTCKNASPIIKPNLTALVNQSVLNKFVTAIKLTNSTFDNSTGEVLVKKDSNNMYGLNVKNNMSDAHITKHIDWGAMAYLSQSRYGKMGNKNYIGTNKEIYRNPSSYSGRGEDIVQTEYSYIEAEKYSYNDHKCLESDSNNCTGEKVKNAGVGASTTGTIYGIYDVSGLAQVAMGKYTDNPTNGFNVNPAIKYLTIYKDSINRKKEKDVLGDGLFETNGWYKDYGSANFNDAYVFLTRGSNYNNTLSGIFGFGVMNINAYTFRIVLIP